MALDLLSENWATWPPPPPTAAVTSSPRVSFSCDVESSEDHHCHRRLDNSLLDVDSPSSSEFNFCVARDRSEQDDSAADELFSDGFLLPLFFLQRGGSKPTNPIGIPSTVSTTTVNSSNKSSSGAKPVMDAAKPATKLKVSKKQKKKQQEVAAVLGNGSAADEKPAVGKQPSSFWGFGRSSSLNYGGSNVAVSPTGRKSSRIFSFPLLSRSKSTGANPSPAATKPRQQHLQSTTGTFNTAFMASAVADAAANASSGSKLSRKGSVNGGSAPRSPYYYGQHNGGAGVRISPVLNVPPPYIPRGSISGIFNLAHLLCSGKDKSRKTTHVPPLS